MDQFGRRYESLGEAARVVGCSSSAVCMVLRGQLTHIRSFMFKHVESSAEVVVFPRLDIAFTDRSGRVYTC